MLDNLLGEPNHFCQDQTKIKIEHLQNENDQLSVTISEMKDVIKSMRVVNKELSEKSNPSTMLLIN